MPPGRHKRGRSARNLIVKNPLPDGGKITMPLEKTFWESYFGMLTDRFGINWMVNCELPSHKNFEDEHRKDGKNE